MARAVTIYGIKNCDTMKKARAWLDKRGIAYAFHDYKAAGIERAKLESWVKDAGWEVLLNRAGTTFRKLPEADKAALNGKKGHCPDAGPALDDQAAGARSGRQAARGLQAGAI
jgi:arsenate reductase